MSQAVIWGAMLAMGVLTLSLRASFLVLPEKVQLPTLLRRALRFVPAAVLTAIYAPELMVQSGAIDLTLDNARLLAGLVAIAVAWRLRRTFFTIVVGMIALHVFGAIIAR
jgi:branched-subunit amino acid transport protein